MTELPELKPGKIWAMRIYPGGRKELRQRAEDMCVEPMEALKRLKQNQSATVRMADAQWVWAMWSAARKIHRGEVRI